MEHSNARTIYNHCNCVIEPIVQDNSNFVKNMHTKKDWKDIHQKEQWLCPDWHGSVGWESFGETKGC